jgi:hypothetical protein
MSARICFCSREETQKRQRQEKGTKAGVVWTAEGWWDGGRVVVRGRRGEESGREEWEEWEERKREGAFG